MKRRGSKTAAALAPGDIPFSAASSFCTSVTSPAVESLFEEDCDVESVEFAVKMGPAGAGLKNTGVPDCTTDT